jgi:hypothetical protein
MSFVTPLYFRLRKKTEYMESDYTVSALIVWRFAREYRGKPDPSYGNSWRYFKIWPLFQYEHDDRGNMAFSTLSLLPFRDPDGYELMYQPFWTLFEYRRFESGEKRLGLLLRTYFQAWGPDFLDIRVPILFSYRRSKDELTKWSILCSMFGYTRDGGGVTMNLFWIPVPVAGGGAKTASVGDVEADGPMDGPAMPVAVSPPGIWARGGPAPADYMRYSKAVF